jgi:hypothetical protein
LIEPGQLTGLVRAAVGPARRVGAITRLAGGSKKGVYRVAFDDGSAVVVYVWGAAENYWPPPEATMDADRAGSFSDASGVELFESGRACLAAIGVRTPRVYLVDRSGSQVPADAAVVEDVPGGNLEARLRADPRGAEPTMARLADMVTAMHRHRGQGFGRPAAVGGAAGPQDGSCEQAVLERAVEQLAQAAARVPRVAAVHRQLADLLGELAAAVRPRRQYGLIHGELGPDHVLIDAAGDPVLIDIEGVMYFDIEWEHVFLQVRFGEHYRWLRTGELDDDRLRLYRLALHLSLVAGPLRLLDGDFPDRDAMLEIVESHTDKALAFVRPRA